MQHSKQAVSSIIFSISKQIAAAAMHDSNTVTTHYYFTTVPNLVLCTFVVVEMKSKTVCVSPVLST